MSTTHTAAAHWIMLPSGGYPYGVEAGPSVGDQIELHGGFTTFQEAEAHRDFLLHEYGDYAYAKVVKIETPEAFE